MVVVVDVLLLLIYSSNFVAVVEGNKFTVVFLGVADVADVIFILGVIVVVFVVVYVVVNTLLLVLSIFVTIFMLLFQLLLLQLMLLLLLLMIMWVLAFPVIEFLSYIFCSNLKITNLRYK